MRSEEPARCVGNMFCHFNTYSSFAPRIGFLFRSSQGPPAQEREEEEEGKEREIEQLEPLASGQGQLEPAPSSGRGGASLGLGG